MKNNCQLISKYAKPKTKLAPRKKKYSLKQHMSKVTSHAPLLDNLQNQLIQQQATNEFFQLFHKNFRVILTENSEQREKSLNQKEFLLPTSRTNKQAKKSQNSQPKLLSKNSSKNKSTHKTKSKEKKKSISLSKNTTAKGEKPTLKKKSTRSCQTVSRKKSYPNSFLEIIPIIKI